MKLAIAAAALVAHCALAQSARVNPFAAPEVPTAAPAAVSQTGESAEVELRGVLSAGADSAVNLSGSVIGIGEEAFGYELVSVESEDSAAFVFRDERVVLTLASPLETAER